MISRSRVCIILKFNEIVVQGRSQELEMGGANYWARGLGPGQSPEALGF